jgi:two-component system, response regulator
MILSDMKEEDVILLIEDDEEKAELIIHILKQHLPGQIRHVDDGQKAINFLFSEESNTTKLILLDLILPKVDGIEILKRIKADPVKSRIPVIILTASSETQAYVSSLGLQPDGYVHKPLKNCA